MYLMHPLLETWPTTQACAPTGNRTSNHLVCRLALNPLSRTNQGLSFSQKIPVSGWRSHQHDFSWRSLMKWICKYPISKQSHILRFWVDMIFLVGGISIQLSTSSWEYVEQEEQVLRCKPWKILSIRRLQEGGEQTKEQRSTCR